MRLDGCSKAHMPDSAGCNVDLQLASLGIIHGGVQNAVEVLLLDVVRVD